MPSGPPTARAGRSGTSSARAAPMMRPMAATLSAPALLAGELGPIQSEIEKRHDESIQRLQHWVRNPSIAAEDRGMDEGCDLMMRMAREAGFQTATRIDSAGQDPDGNVSVLLGAKGVVEVELIASGEAWGRGPGIDVHSSNRGRLDSPAFHLVQALATLVNADGDPAIDGFGREARPPTAEQKRMLDAAAQRLSEDTAKRLLVVKRWAHDKSWRDSLEQFLFSPTVNIEGLVAGHTGPGGKTVLPHRAVAKLDLR